jgi:hypothetical protein
VLRMTFSRSAEEIIAAATAVVVVAAANVSLPGRCEQPAKTQPYQSGPRDPVESDCRRTLSTHMACFTPRIRNDQSSDRSEPDHVPRSITRWQRWLYARCSDIALPWEKESASYFTFSKYHIPKNQQQ